MHVGIGLVDGLLRCDPLQQGRVVSRRGCVANAEMAKELVARAHLGARRMPVAAKIGGLPEKVIRMEVAGQLGSVDEGLSPQPLDARRVGLAEPFAQHRVYYVGRPSAVRHAMLEMGHDGLCRRLLFHPQEVKEVDKRSRGLPAAAEDRQVHHVYLRRIPLRAK